MMKISDSVCVDAPASRVWAALSDLESIHLWTTSIRRSYCVSERTRGVDAIRVCELGGNVTVTETIVAWEEGRSFTYTGVGVPLMKRASNRWSIEEQGDQTLVTTSAEVELKGGVFGRMLEPLLIVVSKRMGRTSLAAFKYFAETGKPYEGKMRRLLPAPSRC